MAITAAVLLKSLPPPAALWPDLEDDETGVIDEDAVAEKLAVFLADARLKTAAIADPVERDGKWLAWARYRVFREVWEIRTLSPASVDGPDQGSASFLQLQLVDLKQMMLDALAEYQAVPVVAAQAPVTRDSYSSRNQYTR